MYSQPVHDNESNHWIVWRWENCLVENWWQIVCGSRAMPENAGRGRFWCGTYVKWWFYYTQRFVCNSLMVQPMLYDKGAYTCQKRES